MQIATASLSHVGLRRSNNEDALLAAPGSNLFVVCDGMGGQDLGEVASELTVSTVARSLGRAGLLGQPELAPRLVAEALRAATAEADAALKARTVELGLERPMGTTLLALVVLAEHAVLAHLGDSRAFHLGPWGLRRLTTDHTLVAHWASLGLLRPEDVPRHPLRNMLLRAVGTVEQPEPDVHVIRFAPGERLLLCTDGLSEMVAEPSIARLAGGPTRLGEVPERLVEAALAGGGRDNVTVVAVERVGSSPAAEGAVTGPWLRPQPALS